MRPHRQGRVYKVDDLHLLGVGIESTVQELVTLDRLVQLLLAHLLVGQGPRIDGVTDPVEALGVLEEARDRAVELREGRDRREQPLQRQERLEQFRNMAWPFFCMDLNVAKPL